MHDAIGASTPKSSVTQLRDVIDSAAAETYVEPAYQVLKGAASTLFQARKAGIIVSIPDRARQRMIADHGQEAIQLLALLDGRVWL